MGTRALLLGVLCLLALLNIAACYGFWGRSRCPYSCVRCSPSGSTRCVQCKAGFKLMYGKTCAVDTSQCAEHCHFCGKNGRNHCDICSRGYILTLKNTCSKDVKCADYCEFCELSGETKCDHCERGYFMTRDRTCVPLIASCAEHCYFCQSNGKHKCDRCYFGYKLTENKTCASIHGECAPNCLTCLRSGKDRCDWCKSGYVMTTKDTCEKKISPCAENCLTCQKNGQKKCDVCYFDYTLTSDKTCARHEQCAAHCFVCFKNGKNKCDLCRHGYTLTLDKTCSTSAKCAEHCHLCLRNGQDKCDVCSSGYTLKLDKTCAKNVKCADHCRSCRFTGESKCDHCDDGYAQTYYKTCIPVKGKPRPGKCPSIPAFAVGICPEACRHDAGCPPDHKCCSTGCGHICKKAVAQTGPCAKHCLSCKENGPQKCDVCERGYKLTKDMNCTSSPLCIEEIEVCLMDWTSVYQQRYDPQSSRSVNTKKLCDLLPEVKDCMEDLRNVCDEDGTWITSMEMLSAYVVNCAPTTGTTTKQSSTTPASSAGGSTKTTTKQSSTTPASSAGRSTKTPTKQSSTTPTSSAGRSTKTPTKLSSTTPASSAVSRSVVMVIRLAKEWKKEYKDFKNTETKELVDLLEVSLHAIFKRVKGFQNVEVKSLFKSSVGVELVVVFDHELTDAERTTLALTLTSALAANNNMLTLGSEDINISGKPEMFVAGEKVEVNGACFLYDKKQLCQNGGSCVAREASARCVCASGYSGMYCNARTSNASTKGRNIVVPVAAGIGVFLLVGIVVLAALLYRKRSAEKQRGTHNPDGGVDNPLYAVYTY